MWKALIWDKGFAKCLWPLSGKSTEIPENGVKQSSKVEPSLLYVDFYSAAECRRGLAMRILSVCPSVRLSVCLSVAWIMTKQKKNLSERVFSLVFLKKMVGESRPLLGWLVSTVGRTSVFGRRTDPVLASACSRRVTTMCVSRPL